MSPSTDVGAWYISDWHYPYVQHWNDPNKEFHAAFFDFFFSTSFNLRWWLCSHSCSSLPLYSDSYRLNKIESLESYSPFWSIGEFLKVWFTWFIAIVVGSTQIRPGLVCMPATRSVTPLSHPRKRRILQCQKRLRIWMWVERRFRFRNLIAWTK